MNRRGSGHYDPYEDNTRRGGGSRRFAERDEVVNEDLLNRVMRHTLLLEKTLKQVSEKVDSQAIDLDEVTKTARDLKLVKKILGTALVMMLPYTVTASVTLIKGASRLDRLEAQSTDATTRAEEAQVDIERIRADIRVLINELKHTQEEKDLIKRMSAELELLEQKRSRKYRRR